MSGAASPAEQLAELPPEEVERWVRSIPAGELDALVRSWRFWARPAQLPPAGGWQEWAYVAGRGAGKSRSGAEFVLDRSERICAAGETHRATLVGRTPADARDVMIEGESGLLACAERRGWRADYQPSKRRVVIDDPATIVTIRSAANPEALRGPEHHTGWGDEVAAWPMIVDSVGNTAWTNLLLGLRLDPPEAAGLIPQALATTTPKPVPVVVEWFRRAGLIPDEDGTFRAPDPLLAITTGTLYDNVANLSPAFVAGVTSLYGGTRLGAQEIEGKLLEAVEGALLRPENIRHRTDVEAAVLAERLPRVVVAIDPPGSVTGAECGIVAAGVTGGPVVRRTAYVLADESMRGTTEEWARRAVTLFRQLSADAIIGEVNNGGDMVRAAVHAVDPTVPFRAVRASRGKQVRAEPVALLYEQGRVVHVGHLGLLESQWLTWVPGEGDSPDRLDAAVWAITDLLPMVTVVPATGARARGQLPTRRPLTTTRRRR